MAFKDYSTTPASNTTLSDGTYVGPNMLRNKVRPALQQIMADGKALANDLEAKVNIAKGDPGDSAYEVAVAEGFVGTEEQWLESLKGAPGAVAGRINVQDAGVLPTNTAAQNVTALNAILASIGTVSGGYGKGGVELFFPPSNTEYQFNATIDLRAGIRIRSTGTRMSAGAKLKWTNTVTGLRIQNGNTTGADASAAGLDGASGVILEGLWIIGNYDGVIAESEAHGIHCRSQFTIRDCMIQYWAGDGIYAVADVTAPFKGNANCSKIDNVWVETVRNGFYCQGGDVNAIGVYELSVVGARRWGVLDLSFLGNLYCNLHIASTTRQDGSTAAKPARMVQHAGALYQVVPGQETWASTNAPTGTTADNQGWLYVDFTGIGPAPAWFSGINLRAGGGFYFGGSSNTSEIKMPYVETDCGFNFIADRVKSDQGNAAIRATNGSKVVAVLSANFGLVYAQGGIATASGDIYSEFNSSVRVAQFRHYSGGTLQGLGGSIECHPFGFMRFGAKLGAGYSFEINGGASLSYLDASGHDLKIGAYKLNGTQVVGPQGAAVADASAAVGAPTQAEFNALVGTVNTLLARLRASSGHGLIA